VLPVTHEAATPRGGAGLVVPQSADRRLYVRHGDHYCEAPAAEIIDGAWRLIAERFHPGSPVLSSPDLVESFLRLQLAPRPWQAFSALLLNRRRRLITFTELFRGTIDQVCIYPREVLRDVISHNAASVIFARNDPCGCAEPSGPDKGNCERLVCALRLIDVRVLDYFIVGETTTSFRALGLI
jgi:DNA repair protein RadC